VGQFGILKDIKMYSSEQDNANPANSGRAFANISGSSCFLVTLDTVSGLAADTLLQHSMGNSTLNLEVVEVIGASNQILLMYKDTHELAVGDVLLDTITDTEYTIDTINAEPTINKFSGDMLYIDNRTAVSYSAQQLVTLRTVIKL